MLNTIMTKFKKNESVKYFNKLKLEIIENFQKREQKWCQVSVDSGEAKLHNHIKDAGCIGDKKGLLEMLQKYA